MFDNPSIYSFPHRHKKKYYNYHKEKYHAVFLNSALLFLRSLMHRALRKKPVFCEWVAPNIYSSEPSFIPTITWVGHSTFLIQIDGITILTDPIFGNASFLFKRIFPPGISLESLTSVDYILLSHNHRDHMDAQTLLHLRSHNPHVLVPEGDKSWFIRREFRLVKEKGWWESFKVMHAGEPLTFTFLPAHHWSQRSLFDRNKSLWGSWMIQYKNYTIYFAGDTAYASHFSKIKDQFPEIDVALMPIGPCEPHELMKAAHLNAQQAGQAFLELNAKNFIPMHWGTFYFGADSFSYPCEQLLAWWQNKAIPRSKLHILKIGQQWSLQKEVEASPSTVQGVNISL